MAAAAAAAARGGRAWLGLAAGPARDGGRRGLGGRPRGSAAVVRRLRRCSRCAAATPTASRGVGASRRSDCRFGQGEESKGPGGGARAPVHHPRLPRPFTCRSQSPAAAAAAALGHPAGPEDFRPRGFPPCRTTAPPFAQVLRVSRIAPGVGSRGASLPTLLTPGPEGPSSHSSAYSVYGAGGTVRF